LSDQRESPPGDSSPRQLPARHGGLTPLPSGATLPLCSGLGGSPPPHGARCCRRGEIILGAITAALGGSGGSNSIPCAQVITPGDWGMWGGRRARQNKLTNRPSHGNGRSSCRHLQTPGRLCQTKVIQKLEYQAKRAGKEPIRQWVFGTQKEVGTFCL
jgi:hypothetical protein